MINRFLFVTFIFAVLGICVPSGHAASDYQMDRMAVSSAGGEAKSDIYYLVGMAGQPVAGLNGNKHYVLNSGFWSGNIGCVVNFTDLAMMAEVWLTDSRVFGYNLKDFSVLAENWYCQCPSDWPLK